MNGVILRTKSMNPISVATMGQQEVQAEQQNEINWEQLYIQYYRLVGIQTPCS
jgi:hypothetical protein